MADTAPQAAAAPAAPAPAAAAPAAPTPGTGAPASTPAGGAPGGQSGTPTFASDKERADHFEARHRDATDELRRAGETKSQHEARLARYKETFGDLEEEPVKPATQGGEQPDIQAVVNATLDARELDKQIGQVPTLVPHAQEVKDLVKGGLTIAEAKQTVASRHNITLGPTPSTIDFLPSMQGGGSMPIADSFSPEQEAAMRADGIDPAKAAKHLPALAKIVGKVKK